MTIVAATDLSSQSSFEKARVPMCTLEAADAEAHVGLRGRSAFQDNTQAIVQSEPCLINAKRPEVQCEPGILPDDKRDKRACDHASHARLK